MWMSFAGAFKNSLIASVRVGGRRTILLGNSEQNLSFGRGRAVQDERRAHRLLHIICNEVYLRIRFAKGHGEEQW